jgi:hypothetical protein
MDQIEIIKNKILIKMIPYYHFSFEEIMEDNEVPIKYYICNLYNKIELVIKKNIIEEHYNNITHKYTQIHNKQKYRNLIKKYSF